jgi:hypothetical protein
LESTDFVIVEEFPATIDRCLDDLPMKHKGEMETPRTHKVQTFSSCALADRVECIISKGVPPMAK